MTLQLEYTCTEMELKEAQSLHLREHYGGGSKWRTRLVLFGIGGIVLAGLYLRFKTEIAPKDRWWFAGLVVVIAILAGIFQRKTRRKSDQVVRVEISEREIAFNNPGGRTAMQWSAFSRCFESPNLFVLLDRQKVFLFTVPKRAFPNEAAQNWFRAQSNQPRNPAEATTQEPLIPGRFVASQGIALTLQLKFRDYLNRNVTTWRIKGVMIAMYILMIGISLFSEAPPDAVNSPGKVLLIMLPMMAAMLVVLVFLVSFLSWRSEKKFLEPQQIVLTGDGIEFVGRDSSGRLPWSTYKYFLENRWSFFVWNPQGSVWLMFPKREFAAPSDLERFRVLLQTNLKPSRWFYM